MRFGVVHRFMTNALAALGVVALVASGQFSRWVSVVVLAGLGLALCVREAWQRHPAMRHLDSGALLLVATVQIARLVWGESVLDVLIEFAAALQIIRLATRKGAAHDQQVIVLALLHLIAGTVLGGGVAYGVCFLGVLVVAPGALVLSHLRREVEGNYRQGARDRTGLPVDVPRILRSRRVVGRTFLLVTCLLSIPIFLFTAALFVVFPRVGLSLLLLSRSNTSHMVGFTDRVDLGQIGVLRAEDTTVAMRVEIDDLPDPPPTRVALYLRGAALDAYDGRAWSRTLTARTTTQLDGDALSLEPERYGQDRGSMMRIDLEHFDPPVVFIPPHAVELRFPHRMTLGSDALLPLRGPEGEIRYQPNDERGIHYEVVLSRKKLATFRRPLTEEDAERYLALPPDLPQRVHDLAVEWTADASTPVEKARAIEERLRTDFTYDHDNVSSAAEQPLDHFLFESKRGHCEYYSTAMAVMLRTLGIPTRNVTGFVGGTYNSFGRFYVVRQSDAHSWVEVHLEEQGWVTFDPTPSSGTGAKQDISGLLAWLRDILEATSQRWDRHVVGYDLEQQYGLWSRLSSRYSASKPGAKSSMRSLLIGTGVVLLGASGIAFAVYMRRRSRSVAPKGVVPTKSPAALVATALYESLESAMGSIGVARPTGVPPLRHAETLVRASHPLAPEILDLTQVYLEARFGGIDIGEDDKREYTRRVKLLRQRPRRGEGVGESAPPPA